MARTAVSWEDSNVNLKLKKKHYSLVCLWFLCDKIEPIINFLSSGFFHSRSNSSVRLACFGKPVQLKIYTWCTGTKLSQLMWVVPFVIVRISTALLIKIIYLSFDSSFLAHRNFCTYTRVNHHTKHRMIIFVTVSRQPNENFQRTT